MSRQLRRKRGQRRTARIIHVLTEGKITEPEYLEALKQVPDHNPSSGMDRFLKSTGAA